MSSTAGYHQQGAALIVTLVMLMLLVLLSSALAEMAILDAKAARNDTDRQVALQAAESALADARTDIYMAWTSASRGSLFSAHSEAVFSPGCNRGQRNPYQGLCAGNAGSVNSLTDELISQFDLSDSDLASVQFGRFTGRRMPSAVGPFPAQLPRYIIELSRKISLETSTTYLYRISALGFGTQPGNQVLIQSVLQVSISSTQPITLKRINWREIQNWQDLRQLHQ